VARCHSARGAFMLPFVSQVNNFFRFAKVFRGDRQSFFSRREERLCSPSLQESTVFFVSAKFNFACVSLNRFPLSRGAFMLPFASGVNYFSSFLGIFVSWWSFLINPHPCGCLFSLLCGPPPCGLRNPTSQ